jgi:transposase InsO family protein
VGIYRSTYYYKPKKGRQLYFDIADKIDEIALEHPYYGYRRITAALKRQGIAINHKKVYRIMKDKNILCRIRKSFSRTTDSAHGLAKYPNLIRNNAVEKVNQIWHADITYIRIATSFIYLAAIIDSYSRMVVGYGIGRTLSADLPIAALNDAIEKRNPSSGLIHHSDQGIQYCSSAYIQILKDYSIAI